MNALLRKLWRDNKQLLVFLALMSVFRGAVADWNIVPSGSMQPTIVEGDRIWINKLAYDVNIPFTHISLRHLADPARGDIVVFDSKAAGKRLVKRVVGLPGDVVEMRDNTLIINSQPLDYHTQHISDAATIRREDLQGIKHDIRLIAHPNNRFSNFPAVVVPSEHYLMLGDNRDNSADSRIIGFVPRAEVVGRSSTVVLSLNYDNYYLPRMDRFIYKL